MLAMKVSIAVFDFEDCDIETKLCAEQGVGLEWIKDGEPEEVLRAAKGSDALITSYGPVTREIIEYLSPELKVISRTGVGVDNIDIEAATEHGVMVCNVPGYATEVVSDHAIALALASLRRVVELDSNLRGGIWKYTPARPIGQCKGSTFGVIGMGSIGQAVARKASGLGFKVICWSRSLEGKSEAPGGYPVVSLERLLEMSDVVSLHTALTPETHHLINEKTISLMKSDAILVNTSRGGVVDTKAVIKALEKGRLWGAALDVFEDEPLDPKHPILKAPRTVLTPHAAYWSEESGVELRTRACLTALEALRGVVPQDCLNSEAVQIQKN